MPEGDTVWLACLRLDAALAGKELVRAELRHPRLAEVDLVGVGCREVVARGKHQLIRLTDGRTLHTHLRMDGLWRFAEQGSPQAARWRRHPDLRVLLESASHLCAGLSIPITELLRTADESRVVGHLGPDLLGPDWDLDEAVRRISVHPERTIGEALLDQRNLAGIGTLYRAETLFLRGLHPRRPVCEVGDLTAVVERAHDLLQSNKLRPGQITTGDSRRGREHWVFERPGQPCLRCGTLIRTEEFGPAGQQRRSYWCPHCQPQD